MNRVEAAIQEGRCVLAVGGAALKTPAVLAELRAAVAGCGDAAVEVEVVTAMGERRVVGCRVAGPIASDEDANQ